MGFSSWGHWLLVGVAVMLLFGKGRFSDMMGDMAKGLKSFKKGLADEDEAPKPATRIEGQAAPSPVIDAEKQADKSV
jgi:sec-independent protein translocase protein TatA